MANESEAERRKIGERRLAESLMRHVGIEPEFATVDDWYNYLWDAAEIAETHPHLLNAWERGIANDR